MTISKKKHQGRLFWGGIILALLLCIGAVIGGVFAQKKSANAESDFVVEESYSLGGILTVPADAAIVYDGNSYTATAVYLVYPSGNARTGREFELSESGEYKLVLEADANGKTISDSQTFSVYGDLYTWGNAATTVKYGKLNRNWQPDYKNGLVVELAEDDTITYNRPINIYESTYINLISMNVMQPDAVANVGRVTVRITDAYDPSVYMDLVYTNDPSSIGSYVRASISGGLSIGVNNKGNGTAVVIPGETGNGTLTKDPNGTSLERNYYEGLSDKSLGPNWHNFTLALDTTSRTAIRVRAVQDDVHNVASTQKRNILVAEFNNPDLFPYTFNGFTTGEVFLSVTAASFGNGTTLAPIEIGEIGDVHGAALTPAQYKDEVGPTITFDVPEEGVYIYAGTPVTIPAATVLDPSGVKNNRATCVVWFNKSASNPQMVSVNNGTFLPNKLGEYTISYTAYDSYGNKGEKDIVLYARDTAAQGQLGIGLTYTPQGANHKAGDILVFSLDDLHPTSLNGDADIVIQITDPDGVVSNVTSTYILEKAGEYKIEYICTDVIYRSVYTDTFTVAGTGQYGFTKLDINTPDYMIKGAPYSIEKVELYQYTGTAKNPAEYNAYMISDGGAPTLIDRDSVTVTASNTVKFRYEAKNDTGVVIESKEIPVVDVGYTGTLRAKDYFVSNEYTANAALSYIEFSGSTSGSIEFVNTLLVQYFSTVFTLPASATNGSVTFKLTDYNDRSKAITITLGHDSVGDYYKMNGGARVSFPAGNLLGSSTTLAYEEVNGELYFSVSIGSTNFRMKSEVTLASDVCLMGISLSGAATLRISQIGNQPFSSSTAINNRNPYLTLKSGETVAEIGTYYKAPTPVFGDILSPTVDKNCTLTISFEGNPLGSYTNVRGDGDYTVLLDRYGEYLFTYSYADGKGRTANYSHMVSVLDKIAPTIALTDPNRTSVDAKVGESIKPLAYTASDNLTASDKLTVSVIVYDANGLLVIANRIGRDNDGSFTLKKAGTYTVYLYCADEMGNTSYVTYTVNAK